MALKPYWLETVSLNRPITSSPYFHANKSPVYRVAVKPSLCCKVTGSPYCLPKLSGDRVVLKPCLIITESFSPRHTARAFIFNNSLDILHQRTNLLPRSWHCTPPSHHHKVKLHTYYTLLWCMGPTLTPRRTWRTWHILQPYESANTILTHIATITPCYHTRCNHFSVTPKCPDSTRNIKRFVCYTIIGTLLFLIYLWPLVLIQTCYEEAVTERPSNLPSGLTQYLYRTIKFQYSRFKFWTLVKWEKHRQRQMFRICTCFPRTTSLFCESSQINICNCRIWTLMPTLYFRKIKVIESWELWAFAEILSSPSFRVEATPRHLPSLLQVDDHAVQAHPSTLGWWCARAKRCSLQQTSGNQQECAWFPASLSPFSAISATAADLL